MRVSNFPGSGSPSALSSHHSLLSNQVCQQPIHQHISWLSWHQMSSISIQPEFEFVCFHQASLNTGSLSSLLSSPDPRLTSLTTPVPDSQSNPLEGGMMVEEPYHTEAYNTPGLLHEQAPRHFGLGLAYRTSLPNLQPASSNIADHHLYPKKFDTMKVLLPPCRPTSDSLNKSK